MNLKFCIFFLWQAAHCQLSPITSVVLLQTLKQEVAKLNKILETQFDMLSVNDKSHIKKEIEDYINFIKKTESDSTPQRKRVSR